MEKRVLKDFIQSLQNRVIVAVSLSVLKSKPADVTAEQYAKNIQKLVFDNWVKVSYISSLENKIIEFQYKNIFKEINEVLGSKEDTNMVLNAKEDDVLFLKAIGGSFPDLSLVENIPDEQDFDEQDFDEQDFDEQDFDEQDFDDQDSETTLEEQVTGVYPEHSQAELTQSIYPQDMPDEEDFNVYSETTLEEQVTGVYPEHAQAELTQSIYPQDMPDEQDFDVYSETTLEEQVTGVYPEHAQAELTQSIYPQDIPDEQVPAIYSDITTYDQVPSVYLADSQDESILSIYPQNGSFPCLCSGTDINWLSSIPDEQISVLNTEITIYEQVPGVHPEDTHDESIFSVYPQNRSCPDLGSVTDANWLLNIPHEQVPGFNQEDTHDKLMFNVCQQNGSFPSFCSEVDPNLTLNALNRQLHDLYLEDTPYEQVPGIYSDITTYEKVTGVYPEDTQDESILSVFSQNGLFADLCSEMDTNLTSKDTPYGQVSDVYLEDTYDELIPSVYPQDGPFPDLCLEEDTPYEQVPEVYPEDTKDELIPNVYPQDGSFSDFFSEIDANMVLNTLDGPFPDEEVSGLHSEETHDMSIFGMYSEKDVQNELNTGVYSQDGLFPNLCSENDTHDMLTSGLCSEDETQNLVPFVCSEEYLDEHNNTNFNFDDNNQIENNVSFMQAMVQLRFPVFSSDCEAVDIIHNLLDYFMNNEKLHKYDIKKAISYSNESADLKIEEIKIIINSSKTDYLIKKCLTSIMEFAYKSIHNDADAIFLSWHGSQIEYLCSILEDVSFHHVCSDYLSKLILKVLDDIWSSEDSSKHILWEHQLHILSVFCLNTHICISVIDFIIVKFSDLINLINKIQIGTFEHLVCIHVIEKVPLFAGFLCIVIKKLQFHEAADIYHTEKDIKGNKSQQVTDLWKLKWRVNNENKLHHNKKIYQDFLRRWKVICEKLTVISATNFPLISVHIWEIMSTLQDLNA
nr:uncharacterized protein LOC106683118 isoform X2 [Halyomorpha halys]